MSLDVVKISNLSFSYAKQMVLEDVSFEIKKRDFLAIIGPNGGGKSTLLKLMMGILTPIKGEVLLFGKPPQKNKTIIGYVPQNTAHNLDFPITVLDVVLMGLLHKRNRLRRYDNELKQKALESLKRVKMDGFANRKIAELSGGERQRVFIARALCSNPDILMLDEPTASIDFIGQREIFELLEELNKNITVMVVSHDMGMVMGYAKHVIYVHKTVVMHTINSHTRYQIKHQLKDHKGHYCGAEFWTNLGNKIECTKECKDA